MALAEPQSWLDERKTRMASLYPELSVADYDSLLNVDGERLRTGGTPSTFTSTALALSNDVPAYDPSMPDATVNVAPWQPAPSPVPQYNPETPDSTMNVASWAPSTPTGVAQPQQQSWLMRANAALAAAEHWLSHPLGTNTLSTDEIVQQHPELFARDSRGRVNSTVTEDTLQRGLDVAAGVSGGLKLPGRGLGTVKNVVADSGALEPASDAVSALLSKIREAKPLEAQNKELLHQFRQRQAGAFSGAIQGGEAGFNRALGAMRGQAERVGFTPLRDTIGQQGVDELFSHIQSAALQPFEHANAGSALRNIVDGIVPVPSELSQLEEVFPGVTKALRDAKIIQGFGVWDYAKDLAELPQSLMSSYDFSGARQVATAAYGHPVMFAKSWRRMLSAARSAEGAQAIQSDLKNRWYRQLPNGSGGFRDLMREAGIADAAGERVSKGDRTFISRLPYHLPGYRGSQEAFAALLNLMRDGVFQSMLKGYGGNPAEIPEQTLRQWGRLVNVTTGHGDIKGLSLLPQSVIDSKLFGSRLFWAPRLVMSRAQMPFLLASKSPQVRGEALRQLSAFIGVNSALLLSGEAAGLWDVEKDPRSADFGQIVIHTKNRAARAALGSLGLVGLGVNDYNGGVRIDPWAGFRPLVNLYAREIKGQYKSTTTGKVSDKARGQIALDFGRQKLAPVPGAGLNAALGKNAIGEDYGAMQAAGGLAVPLGIKDVAGPLFGQEEQPKPRKKSGKSGGIPQPPRAPKPPKPAGVR